MLASMKELDGTDKDMPEDIDEDVFSEVDPERYTITRVPIQVDGVDMVAFGGATYLLKEELKEKGFKFENTVNGEEGVQMWLAPADGVDADALEATMTEYGFIVDAYDAVGEDDEDDDP